MAGEERCRSWPSIAVILVLCSLAPSLTCFSLRGLSEKAKQDKKGSETTVKEVRTGSIFFNGKELNSLSGSASATGNDGLLHIDLVQSDGTEMLEQPSQQEDTMAKEAAWRRLNPSLHCGQNKIKIKAMGIGAAYLQLDMGNTRPLPLIQVSETCGYSMKQNALGLVLVVAYNGCNVMQENGNYVLLMSWLKTPVKFTCPMSTSSAATPSSTTPKPAQQPWKLPYPHEPWTQNRHKRHTNPPVSSYDPTSDYYSYWYWYYYYMYMMTYYPYYSHYPYYPLSTPAPAKPTSTIKTPQKPNPYYPSYPSYYNPPARKPMPTKSDNSEIFYYPLIQHFYGNHPYSKNPNDPMQTTLPPTLTTARPDYSSPTTASPQTTTYSASTSPSNDSYSTQMSTYVPYHKLPFTPHVSYIKDAQKVTSRAGYKSGLLAEAHPYSGFQYWQPVPWFTHSTGKDELQFEWGKSTP